MDACTICADDLNLSPFCVGAPETVQTEQGQAHRWCADGLVELGSVEAVIEARNRGWDTLAEGYNEGYNA
jgi:hypothetical protein